MNPSKGVPEAAIIARQSGVPLRIAAKTRDATKLDRESCRHVPMSRFSMQRMVTDHIDPYTQLLGGARQLASLQHTGADRRIAYGRRERSNHND